MLLSCPPLADQPSGISEDRTPYHSERLAFPKMTAPAFLNCWTTLESLATVDPNSAYDLHVVFNLSLVPKLSFNSMGIRPLSHRKPDAIYSCYGFWLKEEGFLSWPVERQENLWPLLPLPQLQRPGSRWHSQFLKGGELRVPAELRGLQM